MKKVIKRYFAVSYGPMLSRAEVVTAYPLRPQTTIVELLSEMCSDGTLDASFIKVESEHSAMAACIGAASVGARVFTATSSQGLALMHELLHWASGARLPIVMANVNRAMAPGWTIYCDQNDSLSQRDTGWIQFYAESNQEVLDTVIMAYRLSEKVLIPSMVNLDAFFLSHTSEAVDIPDQKLVDEFLPKTKMPYSIDPKDPHSFGGFLKPPGYFRVRHKLAQAMFEAVDVAEEVEEEFEKQFGRRYRAVEPYRCEDAETILVTSGTASSTARIVIDTLRDQGKKVGALKIRMIRPFPRDKVRQILAPARKVTVMDRNMSYGMGGIFFQEVKSALYNMPAKNGDKPVVFGYIAGMGGVDITPKIIEGVITDSESRDWPDDEAVWVGQPKALN
jgi:pyruvate/2-oxoacid:ferredoxin oxidoreductase alpha subunit